MITLTENSIERMAERKLDALDVRYLAGEISAADYDAAIAGINLWVAQRIDETKRRADLDFVSRVWADLTGEACQ